MNLDAIGQAGLRDFVGRYLNAGRLPTARCCPDSAGHPECLPHVS